MERSSQGYIMTTNHKRSQLPVIVGGVRTPFMRSNNAYKDLSIFDLGRSVLSGLVNRTGISPHEIDQVVMGNVIQDPTTSNVARESMLAANIPAHVPAHTVSLACISSNVAATQLADMVYLGRIKVAIASGVESFSDPPIRVSKGLRQFLVKLSKVKKPTQYLTEMRKLSLKDISLDVPKVVEFSNNRSMGQGAEILAQQTDTLREEADQFALRSHQKAAEAQKKGVFYDQLIPVGIPPKFNLVTKDDGPRSDTTMEKLKKLKPAFDRQFGLSTAGNSSFLTDGASALLMMSWQRADTMGFEPLAVIRDYLYGAGDPLTDMLSGPALTIPRLLDKNNLTVDDIDVWEIHEAFASQVVSNLNYLKSKSFCCGRLGLKKVVGEVPLEKVNIWGGSLSIGHPFGATGVRLLTTAAKRLQESGSRYAVVSGCAAGGHGSSILLENPQSIQS